MSSVNSEMGMELAKIIKALTIGSMKRNNERVIFKIPCTCLKCPLNEWFDKTNKSCVHTHQTHWHTPL